MGRDLQTVLDAVLEGILVIDGEGCVEQMNAEACRILLSSAEAAAGQPITRIVGPDHSIAALARQVAEQGRSAIEDDVRVERRFAGDLRVDVAVSPLPDEGGRSGAVVVTLRDRTVRDSLHELVEQRHQLTSYGHIAAGIAHEVKNPLGGIRGAAELLALRAADERAKETAGLIVREVDRITALVDELMVFAQGDRIVSEPVNLHRVLDAVLELTSLDPLSRGVDHERVYDPSIPELPSDEKRLTQVFLNLVRNALQAMEEAGGTLTVRTRMSLDSRIGGSPTVMVEIADTGPGIPAKLLDRLATPFFTTRSEGTGLGLAVSQHWVTRLGGALRISSDPGRGTQVSVSLPLRRSS